MSIEGFQLSQHVQHHWRHRCLGDGQEADAETIAVLYAHFLECTELVCHFNTLADLGPTVTRFRRPHEE